MKKLRTAIEWDYGILPPSSIKGLITDKNVFPNQGERYGAKYENGVAYLLSYTVSVEKLWTQNTRIIHDV